MLQKNIFSCFVLFFVASPLIGQESESAEQYVNSLATHFFDTSTVGIARLDLEKADFQTLVSQFDLVLDPKTQRHVGEASFKFKEFLESLKESGARDITVVFRVGQSVMGNQLFVIRTANKASARRTAKKVQDNSKIFGVPIIAHELDRFVICGGRNVESSLKEIVQHTKSGSMRDDVDALSAALSKDWGSPLQFVFVPSKFQKRAWLELGDNDPRMATIINEMKWISASMNWSSKQLRLEGSFKSFNSQDLFTSEVVSKINKWIGNAKLRQQKNKSIVVLLNQFGARQVGKSEWRFRKDGYDDLIKTLASSIANLVSSDDKTTELRNQIPKHWLMELVPNLYGVSGLAN